MATRQLNWVRCEWHIGGWIYWFAGGDSGEPRIGCKHPASWLAFMEIYPGDPILICGIHLKFLRKQGLAERWRRIPELRERDRKNWWFVPKGLGSPTWETPDA